MKNVNFERFLKKYIYINFIYTIKYKFIYNAYIFCACYLYISAFKHFDV